LFLFDGVCVLCSTGVGWLMRIDRKSGIDFLSAQSELGQAIYHRLGMKLGDSYLLIDADGCHTKTDGFFRIADLLGGPWRFGKAFALIPRPVRDWFYDRLANNRYRLFGTSEHCALLTADQRARLVTDDAVLRAQLAPGSAADRGSLLVQ
jgi:predicted DCC family thiol-disulfide oxidoreductase YuxK